MHVLCTLCFSACGPGRFGPFCTHTCSCANNLICDRFTGECGCESGDDCKQGIVTGSHKNKDTNTFFTHFVQQPAFLPPQSGKVNESCFSYCSYLNTLSTLCLTDSPEQSGSVMVPLPPGERESWGAIGGIVVLVILVVLLLVLLLLYRHRQKDKQNNTPTVSFSTSRTVNSEYAVPGAAHRIFYSDHFLCVTKCKYVL